MTRYINLQDKSIPCAPLNDFNIKIFREKLNDKYGKSPLANQSPQHQILSQKKNSITQFNPSFDLLQNKLKDFASKKSASPKKQKTEQLSPSRVGGMQQSISKISTLNFQLPSKQIRVGSMYNNVSQFNGSISEDRKLIPTRVDTEIPERFQDKQKNMNNLIPLHEIMNMRNKLEHAQININQISSTYTHEMVKLASVINSQLKKQQK